MNFLLPNFLLLASEALIIAGKPTDALEMIEECLEKTRAGYNWSEEIIALTQKGNILAMTGKTAEAEDIYQQAITLAKNREAKLWELRAARHLAGLWNEQGKKEDACELLQPVYDWFTEGHDYPDLKEAEALLHALST